MRHWHFYNFILVIFSFLLIQQVTHAEQLTTVDSAQVKKLNDLSYNLRNSDPNKSLSFSRLAFDLSVKSSYITGQINSLVLIGMVYKNLGSYDKAMDAYFSAMRIAEANNDRLRVSSCLNNIGSVFQSQGNYQKALNYYLMSMKIEEDLGNKEQLSIRLYNIGTVYELLDSLELASAYYYNSLLIEEKSGNKEGIYFALYGIAGIDTKQGRYESAMNNITRALRVAHELRDPLGISVCHCEMGKLFLARENLNSAIVSFDSSIYYANQGNLLNEMKEAYFNLSLAYKKKGDGLKAYENLSRYVEINDSLNSLGIKSRVAELEAKFQVDQKEKEITYLKEKGQLKSDNADFERRNRNFLLITVILAIFLAVYNLKNVGFRFRRAVMLSAITLLILSAISLILLLSGAFSYEATFSNFFKAFADVLTYSVLPIFVFIFLSERILLNRYLKKAGELTEQIKTLNIQDEGRKINLSFDGKEGNLSLDLGDLICFEANDNYTAIYYIKNGEVKKELRRITLKRIEDQLTTFPEIIRCHKSFIINILNVSHVSGNTQGYKFHLKQLDFSIPVSRKFPQSMITSIKSRE
jgi:tetratricopeptide (TPR) repeat protein